MNASRWFVNPEAVTIHIALTDDWFECIGCRKFTPRGLNMRCEECGGNLSKVTYENYHPSARRKLFTNPSKEVFEGKRIPFTLRSEEHSAQLSSKDVSDIFSPSEKYELLFQDIMISDYKYEQPVDILSSTTTMEVGIDIGSLTGVGMRTIPPLPSNYQQRAGRSGRRGASLSTIVTYADNSPYETYIYEHPELLIGAENVEPIVYVNNKKIIERHISATLIQKYFRSAPISQTADVFESLGSGYDFFEGTGDFSFSGFKDWVKKEIEPHDSKLATSIGEMIPESIEIDDVKNLYWKGDLVRTTSTKLINALTGLSKSSNWTNTNGDTDDLLSILLDAAILPTFSFPIDVCNFVVYDDEAPPGRLKVKYEMGQDMKQALSEYVPNRQIVVDKKTYTSYGLNFRFSEDQLNRAKYIKWDSLEWLNYCGRCGSVLADKQTNLEAVHEKCHIPICKSEIKSIRILKPEGFSPEVKDRRVVEGETIEDERIYAKPAQYPLPTDIPEIEGIVNSKNTKNATIYEGRNQELEVVNFGPGDSGFYVCRSCGAIGSSESLSRPHNRPYQIPSRSGTFPISVCSGVSTNIAFGYAFRSDVCVMRVSFKEHINLEYGESWFESACRSLSEALVLGATRILSIDSTELSGSFRPLPPTAKDANQGISGYVEFFLYDTTPGGAGFASSVFKKFSEVLMTTKKILKDCECEQSCQRCLRNYSNRIWHDLLDRHLALALLDYASDGTLPVIDDLRSRNFMKRLGRTLQLISSKVSIKVIDNVSIEVFLLSNKDLNKLKVHLISCMSDKPIESGEDLFVSDYKILHNLPSVAAYIMERIANERR